MTGHEELDFIGLVDIAVRLVQDEYPDAELFEGDGKSPTGLTSSVHDVNKWRFTFRASKDGTEGTALIETKDWGEFNHVEFVDKSWLGDRVIPWPIDIDIAKADETLKESYPGEYVTVTLRWPLYAGLEEPFYIFGTPAREYWFVGVYTGNVIPPGEQVEIPKASLSTGMPE